MKVNKKTAILGGLVVAGLVYGVSRTERGTKVRQRVSRKVPKASRILDDAKEATQDGVARAQEVLGAGVAKVRATTGAGTKQG